MTKEEVEKLISERYQSLPPKLKVAARHVLDAPKDIAIQSMRSVAAPEASSAAYNHSNSYRNASARCMEDRFGLTIRIWIFFWSSLPNSNHCDLSSLAAGWAALRNAKRRWSNG